MSILPFVEEVFDDPTVAIAVGPVIEELPPLAAEVLEEFLPIGLATLQQMNKANPRDAAHQLLVQMRCTVPVDISALVEEHGITVVRRTFERSVTGMLVIDGSRVTLVLNDLFDRVQQRFWLAHLFAHFVLHKHSVRLFVEITKIRSNKREATDKRLREQEANEFAMELLMPEHMLKEGYAARPPSVNSSTIAPSLATKFAVTELLFAVRMSQLGLCNQIF
jgi:Zn-dependent peptidase ImmA (M78 family)